MGWGCGEGRGRGGALRRGEERGGFGDFEERGKGMWKRGGGIDRWIIRQMVKKIRTLRFLMMLAAAGCSAVCCCKRIADSGFGVYLATLGMYGNEVYLH